MTRRLVVVGDPLLDVDLLGAAHRLCPDAPVPVVDDAQEHPRPGGAALAAQLAVGDGWDVVLVAPVAADDAARVWQALLDPAVTVVAVGDDGPTAVKRRVRAGGQSIVRLDSGTTTGRVGPLPPEAVTAIAAADAVLVSDYGRGVTALPDLRRCLRSLSRTIPVVWDPHPRGTAPVPGARLATPNLDEAVRWSGQSANGSRLAVAEVAARTLMRSWRPGAVAVTLGAEGALLSYGSGASALCPAPAVVPVDPCGAGDRFAVTAALRLGEGGVIEEAVQSAVRAASEYVATGGAAAVANGLTSGQPAASGRSKAERVAEAVRGRGGTLVATGGCFDLLHAGHVASLRAARRLGDALIVCLNSDASVRRLKGAPRPLVPQHDRVQVLEALEFVDAVWVFDEDTPTAAIRALRPDIWAKGGDYTGAELPEASVLAEWRGQAVILPYLRGRSTTGLVRTAATAGPPATAGAPATVGTPATAISRPHDARETRR